MQCVQCVLLLVCFCSFLFIFYLFEKYVCLSCFLAISISAPSSVSSSLCSWHFCILSPFILIKTKMHSIHFHVQLQGYIEFCKNSRWLNVAAWQASNNAIVPFVKWPNTILKRILHVALAICQWQYIGKWWFNGSFSNYVEEYQNDCSLFLQDDRRQPKSTKILKSARPIETTNIMSLLPNCILVVWLV